MDERNLRRRERLLELQKDRRYKRVDFRICRVRQETDASKIAPWDGFDFCACGCGREVVYDRQDSEGVPHICPYCAYQLMRRGLKALDPLNRDLLPPEGINQQEAFARVAVSVAQQRQNEYQRVVAYPGSYKPPTHQPGWYEPGKPAPERKGYNKPPFQGGTS